MYNFTFSYYGHIRFRITLCLHCDRECNRAAWNAGDPKLHILCIIYSTYMRIIRIMTNNIEIS